MAIQPESRPYAVVDSPWADKYLARRREWDWHSADEIDVFGPDGTIIAVLRDWQTPIFHIADGNNTLQEFVSSMADHYRPPAAAPADLNQLLLAQTRVLVEDLGVLELWDQKADLAREYDLPRSERDEPGEP